jgi:hypothetical protein
MATQNRRFARKSFGRVAALDMGDGSPSIRCEVLDISEGGARLAYAFRTPKAIPDVFFLLLSPCGRVRRKCRVAWRRGIEMGVMFEKSPLA